MRVPSTVTSVVFVDDTLESRETMKLLQQKSLRFLMARVERSHLKPSDRPPVLFMEGNRVQGIEEIRKFLTEKRTRFEGHDEQASRTAKALQVIGEGTTMWTLNNRLRVQKIVYLLQHCGLRTNWKFDWYLRGPYSPDLTNSMYAVWKSRNVGEAVLDSNDELATRKVKDLLPRLTSAKALEAAASLLYIREEKEGMLSDSGLVAEIVRRKPFLTTQMVGNALTVMRELGIWN